MSPEAFGAMAGRVLARLAKHVDLALATVDLTLSQYRLLSFLADGEAASSRLAGLMAISPPSVTSVVDGLVARGLVERRPDPSDRRRQSLVLTASGRAALVEADGAVGERLEGLLAFLDGSRSEVARDALGDWRDALDQHRAARQGMTATPVSAAPTSAAPMNAATP